MFAEKGFAMREVGRSMLYGAPIRLPTRYRGRRLMQHQRVIVVNPAKHPEVKKDLAQAFADWVLSRDGQETIASYKINGEQLFFPNAKPRR